MAGQGRSKTVSQVQATVSRIFLNIAGWPPILTKFMQEILALTSISLISADQVPDHLGFQVGTAQYITYSTDYFPEPRLIRTSRTGGANR